MADTLPAKADARSRPRLRAVSPEWVEHGGQPLLLLRDPLHLSDSVIAVPGPVALLLSLFDGERDLAASCMRDCAAELEADGQEKFKKPW